MNCYWLARGKQGTEGPFEESQLLAMWRAGQVTADCQICAVGSERWVPLGPQMKALVKLEQLPALQSAKALKKLARQNFWITHSWLVGVLLIVFGTMAVVLWMASM